MNEYPLLIGQLQWLSLFQEYGAFEKLEFEHKIDDLHRMRWKKGDWTDDTDQLILIMQSLLENVGEVRHTPPVACVYTIQ